MAAKTAGIRRALTGPLPGTDPPTIHEIEGEIVGMDRGFSCREDERMLLDLIRFGGDLWVAGGRGSTRIRVAAILMLGEIGGSRHLEVLQSVRLHSRSVRVQRAARDAARWIVEDRR